VAGNVAATEGWLGVALLGFNLNQDPATADCNYVPVDPNAEGPPAVTVTEAGLAVNFVKRGDDKTFTLRAQIQGPDGASDPNDRWCANITEAQGKELIPWEEFNTECWEGGEGADYNGEPISAVVFTVPGNGWAEGENGTADDVPYDFCINGLAAGNSPEDAPDGAVEQEDLTGVIGGDATGADFERVKVAAGGESYVIQNNNWGNIAGAQSISFINNSFTITDGPDGSPSCQGCPLSFPSIYIGASGNTDSGKYDTRSTDNLPAAISSITSAQSSVRWSGNPGAGANASYDIWFAKSSRGDLTGQRYNDGLDGFIMLWLYDPANAQPIGSDQGDVRINNIDWDVWVGPRGQGPSSEGADLAADPNAPVISYVAKASVNTFDGDLKAFFTDATNRSAAFTSDLLLTDVFFGFEIWSGGQGLKVDSFEVQIAK
jgi:Glycosyl hydrolase family 12